MKAHFAAAFIVALATGGSVAQAQDAVQKFHAGRTMDMVIGYPPGGGFDSSARLLIRHMPKHLPGSPVMIPKNMPGAGSLVAANYLYNVAPKDGSEFGIIGDVQTTRTAPGSIIFFSSIRETFDRCALFHHVAAASNWRFVTASTAVSWLPAKPVRPKNDAGALPDWVRK